MLYSYSIPASAQQTELIIKRSRFICNVAPVNSIAAVHAHQQACRDRYPDANHHCFAYVAGAPDDTDGMGKGDDGEPQGTAGKPMLNVLTHSEIGQTSIVVIRYFGGIKLGAGGLVRAYTQSVSQALLTLPLKKWEQLVHVEIELPYALTGSLEHWLSEQSLSTIDKIFTDIVTLQVAVPQNRVATVTDRLENLFGGKLQIRIID